MSRFPIACQTITFGPDQRHRLPEVFAAVRDAGYGGVEIGFRHFEHLPPDEFRKMLSGNALHLAASHTSGDLSDRGWLDRMLDYLNAVGTTRLLYSGLKWENANQFERDLAGLNRAAVTCTDRGIRLCYHNHDWEFRPVDTSGFRIIDAVLRDGAPELSLCPDIGWAHVAGTNVNAFLMKARDRLATVHFKDFSTRESGRDFVTLGQGVVPLGDAALWLREHTNGMWIVAEQDTARGAPEDAVRKNAAFLRKLF